MSDPAAASAGPALLTSVRRLGRTVRPIRGRLLLGMLSATAASLLALGVPQVIQYLINTSLGPDPAAVVVVTAAGIVLALGFLEAVFIYLRRIFALYPAIGVERGLRVGLFGRLLRLPVSFHDEWGSGQLLSRSMNDLSQVRRFIAFGALMFVANSVMIGAGILLMFRADTLLALLFLAAAVPIAAVAYWFNRRFSTLSRLAQDQSGDLATTIEQSVQGIRVLKAFGRGPEALAGFTDQAEDLLDTEVSKAEATARFNMAMIVLPEVALGLALLAGIWRVAEGTTDVGQLSAYFATATLVTGPVRMIGMILGMAVNTRTALDRHDEVMDTDVAITDPDHPAAVEPAAVRGAIELAAVAFRYDDAPPDHPPVLEHVDLRVAPGETMALVGVTGSGKSTLLQLIPRLYDPTAGTVSIDGVDVRDMRLDDLHRITAFAFEEATLFSSSVRDNVLLGVDGTDGTDDTDGTDGTDDTAGDESLLATALHTADAQFAANLPDGVDTRIGEQGLSLSGGQRQRLALARAIAARPRVLLLDDPLSALDTRTEETVTERLRDVLAGTTTLIVAHRTSTVALADRVALLDEGRITAVGTHPELMATNDRYRWVIAYLAEEHARNRDLAGIEDDLGGDGGAS